MTIHEKHRIWLEGRGIDPALAEKFGIETTRDDNGYWLTVPYLENGEVINHKWRQTSEKRHRMDAGAPLLLWNVDCLNDPEVMNGAPVVITEGEWDALAALAAGQWAEQDTELLRTDGPPTRLAPRSDGTIHGDIERKVVGQFDELGYLSMTGDELTARATMFLRGTRDVQFGREARADEIDLIEPDAGVFGAPAEGGGEVGAGEAAPHKRARWMVPTAVAAYVALATSTNLQVGVRDVARPPQTTGRVRGASCCCGRLRSSCGNCWCDGCGVVAGMDSHGDGRCHARLA